MREKKFMFQNRHRSNELFKRTRLGTEKNAVEFRNLKSVICRVTLPLHGCNPDKTVEGYCLTLYDF